jgi:hypothetical protein
MYPLTEQQNQVTSNAPANWRSPSFRPTAEATDASEAYPWRNVERLREAGFMGMTIPAAYGGKGLSYHDAIVVVEEMAKACATMGRITVEANMGAIGAIMAYGSDAQKRMAARMRARGRQTGDLHLGAERGQRGERDDDARRSAWRCVCDQWAQVLDHGWRRVASAPDFRARVRPRRRGRESAASLSCATARRPAGLRDRRAHAGDGCARHSGNARPFQGPGSSRLIAGDAAATGCARVSAR